MKNKKTSEKHHSFISLYAIILISLNIWFLGSCSNQMQPDGGPKDSLRPFIQSSIPQNQGINFKGEKIVLVFNEWVREKNLRQELLITPPNTKYTHKIIKNRLEITFDEPLKSNTTYSFSFREGIEDITEGNKAVIDTLNRQPLKIAFSTGPIIDSMKISGQVKNRLNDKMLEKVVIALYRTDDTLNLAEDAPYYYTITDKEGNFKLENIKSGEYKFYAYLDKNSNTQYNEPEAIDFFTEVIRLEGDSGFINDITFKLSPEDHTAPEIKSKSINGLNYQIDYDEGLDTFQITNLNAISTQSLSYQLKNKGKTLEFYNSAEVYDSLSIAIMAQDSSGNIVKNEVMFAFKNPEEEKERRNRRESSKPSSSLNFEIKTSAGTTFERDFELVFEFEKPVKDIDFDKIIYIPDEDSSRIAPLINRDSTQFYQWNNTRSELRVKYPKFFFSKKIRINADTAAFISVLNDSTRLLSKVFERKEVGDFSSIYGQVSTQTPHYILQLLTENGELIGERINPVKYEFNYLRPGTYKLRIVIDTNQNNRWDASDWINNIRAEDIIFPVIPNEGKLRERWDIEALIEF